MGFLTGSSNKASQAAEEEERKRKAEIAAGQSRVEGIFGSDERQADILGLEDAVRAFLQGDLDRKKTDTDRNLKFALARGGLSKGSVDVDSNLRLGDDFLRGILEVERRSKAAGTSLRSEDQATKNSLFSQILGGLDATTAAQRANTSLQQNIDLTKSSSFQQGIGDLFSDFTNIFKSSKQAAADRTDRFDFNALYGKRLRSTPSVAGSVQFAGG